MKVYLNKITGIDDAIVSMYMSKRTWTRELEEKIRRAVYLCTNHKGALSTVGISEHNQDLVTLFKTELEKVCKWGKRHMTMLRFVDISVTVEGMHRAGQDDVDSHAMRFNNRIIRSSTRLAKFGNEMSDYYSGKVIPTDVALAALGITAPETLEYEGQKYVKTVNGYVLEGMENNKDVLRGLYMLSIPSNFIFKCQLTEWAHVYKERNKNGTANPEVKEFCEAVCDQLEAMVPQFNRELFEAIPN